MLATKKPPNTASGAAMLMSNGQLIAKVATSKTPGASRVGVDTHKTGAGVRGRPLLAHVVIATTRVVAGVAIRVTTVVGVAVVMVEAATASMERTTAMAAVTRATTVNRATTKAMATALTKLNYASAS